MQASYERVFLFDRVGGVFGDEGQGHGGDIVWWVVESRFPAKIRFVGLIGGSFFFIAPLPPPRNYPDTYLFLPPSRLSFA